MRMLVAFADHQLLHLRTDRIGVDAWRARAILQPFQSAYLMTVHPLVAGGPSDAIKPAQLGHIPVATVEINNKSHAFFEHTVFLPGHKTFCPKSVYDVPGMFCIGCARY